ncbi:Sec-C motif domain protein [Tenacibaculum sp. AHE15PA]|uniref:YchJ family protein n=1 Tax=unclassified Tenacibaculum TaxID=2635139 RepID=UPI001C4E56C5|nr:MULTISPECIES: YchJ family metal-binding protein [unclassified Tenacibaculum]QXP73671.1 Sec-C motif domain protein [Tenacibaculum sp. AHE14PA]QXP75962.1 Sec-C motif domain protein [Tenacibaculum sp. AHE15PA]
MQCPCNPSNKYSDCCEKAHQNIQTVLTAEVLMRSRYSAFVLANINYLKKSHHSSIRPSDKENKEISQWTKSVEWIKLEVLNTTKGAQTDLTGTVEFKAFFIENGNIDIIHENSSFCKENNHWVYLKAD